jgi:hypothetical protein
MIPSFFLDQIRSDCTILLKRALLGKTMAVFGIDGFGLHGYSFHGKHFPVTDVTVLVTDDGEEDPKGMAMICLDGYNSGDCGHLSTDQNLRISLNKCLQAEVIDPTCWSWAPIDYQGLDFFVIELDVPKLLGWV